MWFKHPLCICICCCVASGISQGSMFPEVWGNFHEHVENQVTTGVLRLLSVITSQFVTCINIIGWTRHGRNNLCYIAMGVCLNICAGRQIISSVWLFNDQIPAHNQEPTVLLLWNYAQFKTLNSKYDMHLFFITVYLLSPSCKVLLTVTTHYFNRAPGACRWVSESVSKLNEYLNYIKIGHCILNETDKTYNMCCYFTLKIWYH